MRFFFLSILLIWQVANLCGQCTLNPGWCQFTPLVEIECVCDIPIIEPVFQDVTSIGNIDVTTFNGLATGNNISPTSGPCGTIYITANDQVHHAVDCMDSFYIQRVYSVRNSLNTLNEPCVIRYVPDIAPGHFSSNSTPDVIVSCEENVDSLFNAFIQTNGYNPIMNNCNNDKYVEYSPGYDVLQPSVGCAASGFTKPQFTVKDLICSPKCEAKFASDPSYLAFFENPTGIGPRINEKSVSGFQVLDTIKPELVCAADITFDIGETDLELKIEDHLKNYTLDNGCTTVYPTQVTNPGIDIPVVTDDFRTKNINLDSCDTQTIIFTTTAKDTCNNIGTCQTRVLVINETGPMITSPPLDTLFLECGDSLVSATLFLNWKASISAIDFKNRVIDQGRISSNFNFNALGQESCDNIYEVNFTAVDICDNVTSTQGVVVIDDTQSPLLLRCPMDTTVTADDPLLAQSVNNWLAQFQAQDDCKPQQSLLVSNNYSSDLIAFSCGTRDTLITFIADDGCSVPTNCSAKLTILDNVIYDFSSFPADTVIQCTSPTDRATIELWMAQAIGRSSLGNTYSGGLITTDLDYTDPRLMSCNSAIDITFSFEDPCGFSIDRIAKLGIRDDEDPTINCPGPASFIGDFAVIQPDITAWIETAIGSDNCTYVVDNNFSQALYGDCKKDTITNAIQFWSEDGCNNRSLPCSVDLTIISPKDPLISCPTPLVLECGSAGMLDSIQSWVTTVSSTDFVGEDILPSFDLIPSSLDLVQCQTTTPVVFTVEDTNCNRTKTCETSVTIQDTQNPNILCPPTLELTSTSSSIDQDILDWIASASYDDNDCMTPNFSTDPLVSSMDICAQNNRIDITFTVVDMCLNQAACIGIIEVNTAGPSITCPSQPLALECGDPDAQAKIDSWLLETSALDNSNTDLSALISNDYTATSLSDTCTQTKTVEFSIEDSCGSPSSCLANIIVTDNTAPEVDCPAIPLPLLAGDTVKIPKFLTWLELIPVSDCNTVSISDNFDESLLAGFDCDPKDYSLDILFTDACGSATACQATISVQNNITTTFMNCDPTVNNITVECGSVGVEDEIRLWMAEVIAVDLNNQAFPTSPDLDVTDPNLLQCNSAVPVTFTLSDQCGLAQSCMLTLTIEDTTDPFAICPQDASFVLEDSSFDQDVTAWLTGLVGSDNCISENSLNYVNDYSPVLSLPNCVASQVFPVMFSVSDGCGNSSTCVSSLTVTTVQVPRISCPANQLIECGDPNTDNIIADWIALVEGFDANDVPLIPDYTFDMNEVNSINCDGEVAIMFKIIDSCSIEDSCSSSIIIQDTTRPIATCPPSLTINTTDLSAPQKMQDWIDSYNPSDNCSMVTASIQNGIVVPSSFCNSTEDIDLEFYAEDACGQRDTCATTISVNHLAPSINCLEDIEIECGASDNNSEVLAWIAGFSAEDNNAAKLDVSSTYTPLTLSDECEITSEIVFTATDNCGNTSTCMKMIIQKDNLAPEITRCPQTTVFDIAVSNLSQDVDNWLSSFEAEDQCNVAMISNDYALDLQDFDCGSEQDVIFTAVDDCGNLNSTCRAHISFENNLEVTIICPEPSQIKCNEDQVFSKVLQFLDGYQVESEDPIYEVNHDLDLENLDTECSAQFTQDISFTLVDNCGNSDECMTSLEFIPNAQVYIPTIFAPALGGEDANFVIRTNIAITEIKSLRIYSRWGDLMFENTNFDPNTDNGWNGRDKSGKHVQGVYMYVLDFEDIFGNAFNEVGHVTML